MSTKVRKILEEIIGKRNRLFYFPVVSSALQTADYVLNLNNIRGVAQTGSALGLGPRGRRFKSALPDQKKIYCPPKNTKEMKEAPYEDLN